MIRLKKFDRDGYADLISWVDSEETLMQFAGPLYSYPLTPAQLDESLSDPNRTAFCILHEEGGGAIGNDEKGEPIKHNEEGKATPHADEAKAIGHAEIYYSERSAKLGRILIGDERQRGKGLGEEIVRKLLDLAFASPAIEMVELNVFDWNKGAIRCYEKVGFVINPDKKLLRQVKGETWTAINMTMPRAGWKGSVRQYHYTTKLDVKFDHLSLIDVPQIVKECTDKWFNQTLTRVNDSVVRLGIVEGEYHWHKHDEDDEFFFVLEGQLIIDTEKETIVLDPWQGFTVSKGTVHRTRAMKKTIMLMVETYAIEPTGD